MESVPSKSGAFEKMILEEIDPQHAVGVLQKVIQIESTNPPGNEVDLARWLEEFFRDHGLRPQLFEYEGKHANLVVRIAGSKQKPALIFSAHMDTVPAGEEPWAFAPFAGTCHEGRIYGRGAADMKGGLAAMAEAVVILAQCGFAPRGDLILALTHDETHGLQGAKRLIETGILNEAGALLVSEPSGLDVFIAEKGALWLKCRAHGKVGHSSMPHMGVNAILAMVDFLHRLTRELDLADCEHGLLGTPTLTVGTIAGGVTINVIPDACSAELDLRLLPGQDPDEVLRRVQHLAPDSVSVDILDWKEPVTTDPEEPFVALALEVAAEVTAKRRAPKGVSYYTDAAVLANSLHIPFVNIGPADTTMTHQPDENVEIERFLQAIKVYLLIAIRYLL